MSRAPLTEQQKEDLKLARRMYDFFKTHSWGQGQYDYYDPTAHRRRFCTLGCAYTVAREIAPLSYTQKGNSTAYLMGFQSMSELIAWNDTKGRTKRDVMNRLLLARKFIRAGYPENFNWGK